MIQNVEQLHGDWVVNYKTTMLQRLKPNCQHRFLCVKNESEKRIILLNGMLKKRKHLPDKKIVEADAMFAEFGKGHGSVEDYQFD